MIIIFIYLQVVRNDKDAFFIAVNWVFCQDATDLGLILSHHFKQESLEFKIFGLR